MVAFNISAVCCRVIATGVRTQSTRTVVRAPCRMLGNGTWDFSWIENEPVLHYGPGSPERAALAAAEKELLDNPPLVPCIVNGKEIFDGVKSKQVMPCDHSREVCTYVEADKIIVENAMTAAVNAQAEWADMPFEDRAAVFLKAADLVSTKYRAELGASAAVGTSKTPWQQEIDITEICDFFKFAVANAAQIYQMQPPKGTSGIWNRSEFRPLEGFTFAVSPFNFAALGANLAGCPALMGNTVVWKPSETAVHEGYVVMKILKEAGLPDGVINFIPGDGATIGSMCIPDSRLAGVSFTGSSATFDNIWKQIADNLSNYRVYPRLIGETGGKNFHFIHESADIETTVNTTVRGAFEYQGQKCSATSRMYVPTSLWNGGIRDRLVEETAKLKMGCATDFSNFMCAVIDQKSFDKNKMFIENAKSDPSCEIIAGGGCDDSKGYFIQPTIILTTDPKSPTMTNELFGPVLTVYCYDAKDYEKTLELCDSTSTYALTGSIFAQERTAVATANKYLKNSAGNYYVNDKCTGAVVGMQPFGGARKSGTNDKTGTVLGLLRWVSQRTIKENFVPQTTVTYPSVSDQK